MRATVTGPAAGAVRRHFRRCRRRIIGAVGLTVAMLVGFALLLVAPNRLASLRLGEVALAWWALLAVALMGIVAVSRGFQKNDPVDGPESRTSRLMPLFLTLVWGSPALCLGLPPLLWTDGTRGLWPIAVVIGGAVVAMLLLGSPLTRAGGFVARTSEVVRVRWPRAGRCQILFAGLEALVAALFVWAQLAAVRELGTATGWPPVTGVCAVVLVGLAAALLRERSRIMVAAVGGGLALLAVATPLLLVALTTTTGWPGVWSAVASRPRIAFIEGTSWTLDGGAARGSGGAMTMHFTEEQRVVFVDPGSVTVESRAGKPLGRDVQAGEEISVHPGDQLTVPKGMRLRFEPGRRVPDAPDSGPAWVEPPSGNRSWLGLVTLGLTAMLGLLGLPVGTVSGSGRASLPRRGAQLTAGLVMVGATLVVGWSLYALWLTPEVYAGGVTGTEVFALPASVARLGGWGDLLAACVLGGLALGGAASALAGCPPLASPAPFAARGGWTRQRGPLLILGVGALAYLVPAGSWAVLLLALGVAAATLAPAVVLACWSERVTPGGIAAGATAGLLTFLVATFAGVLSPGWFHEWRTGVASGPAVIAVPMHLLVAWALRSRRTTSPRLPEDLAGLTAVPPARTG